MFGPKQNISPYFLSYFQEVPVHLPYIFGKILMIFEYENVYKMKNKPDPAILRTSFYPIKSPEEHANLMRLSLILTTLKPLLQAVKSHFYLPSLHSTKKAGERGCFLLLCQKCAL
jgi:hypothetical protein